MSEISKFQLKNGVRVLVEPIGHVQSAAIGLWCQTGSTHEKEHEAGITHLIEHMLFKGTDRRSAKQIAEEIEGRGGNINAFTDKEATCYYCRVLAEDLEPSVDVLADMMLNSLIDPEELKREEGVVIEEIKRSEDEPSDHVHELHLEGRWSGHPLGKPVIGTRESVAAFRRENLKDYLERRYRGPNVVLAVAGNVSPDSALATAERLLESVPEGSYEDGSMTRPMGRANKNEVAKEVEQVHFCIGGEGVSIHDEDRHTLAVLDTALGGSMSSRLFQEIREKRGLAYSIGSYCLTYSAGGAFTVYGGTSLESWSLVQDLVQAEITKVVKHGLNSDELARTKKQLAGHLVLGLEGMSARMMRMSRNELNYGRDVPVDEVLAKLNAVENHQIIALADRLLDKDSVSVTAIGPFKAG